MLLFFRADGTCYHVGQNEALFQSAYLAESGDGAGAGAAADGEGWRGQLPRQDRRAAAVSGEGEADGAVDAAAAAAMECCVLYHLGPGSVMFYA